MQKIKCALEEAEKLSESLRERYTQPQGKRVKLDSNQPQEGGMDDQKVPNDAKNDKPLSAEDLYRRNSVRLEGREGGEGEGGREGGRKEGGLGG